MDPMTTAELGTYLKLSARTLHNWRYKGAGPRFMKAGGVVRYRLEDVQAWERSHIVEPGVAHGIGMQRQKT